MPQYCVINDYLCVEAGTCTCGMGPNYEHESYCGWEPINKVDTLLADITIGHQRTDWAQIRDHDSLMRINLILHDFGIDHPQGANGVRDLAQFAKQYEAEVKIARDIIRTGPEDLVARFEKAMEEA